MLNIEHKNPTWREAAETFIRSLKESPSTERAYFQALKNMKSEDETLRFVHWLTNPTQAPEQVAKDKVRRFEDDQIVWEAAPGHEIKFLEETNREGCTVIRMESRPIKKTVLGPLTQEEEKVVAV